VSGAFAVVVRTMLKIARWQLAMTTCCVLSAALAACGGNANVPSTSTAAAPFAQSGIQPESGPALCKGHIGTTVYASAVETMRKSGGLLCVPSFANFSGTLSYPGVAPAGSVQVTSSTTNFNNLLPDGENKAIFYIQFLTTAPTTSFGTKFNKTAAFAGKSIKAGKTYTIFGEAKGGGVAGATTELGTCYTVATAGKDGGVIAALGSVLADEKITQPSTVSIQVYAKKIATKKC
jgi:hypothetical protein